MGKQPRRDPRRGRHKKARSPETIRWEADHLPPPPPPWLELATYHRLMRLRNGDELGPS